MDIRGSMIDSFQPSHFIKVGKMSNGEPQRDLLQEIEKSLGVKWSSLLDSGGGVIYLKKKKKGEN